MYHFSSVAGLQSAQYEDVELVSVPVETVVVGSPFMPPPHWQQAVLAVWPIFSNCVTKLSPGKQSFCS